MPAARSRRRFPSVRVSAVELTIAAAMVGVLAAPSFAERGGRDPTAVRSRRVEIHYRVPRLAEGAEIELWYTRDRGATWLRYGVDPDRVSPVVFEAEAEGLYGFTIVVREGGAYRPGEPQPDDKPQRWVFIDYTPPLVQWDSVVPGDDFVHDRVLHLGWTAHDSHFPARPVGLWYHCSVDQVWRPIGASLPNTGRFDWRVPASLTGQVTLRLRVHDEGGHIVDRLYGPVPVIHWERSPITTRPAATSQPAAEPEPAEEAVAASPVAPTPRESAKARDLYERGLRHFEMGEYGVARARFREALALDPDLLAAREALGEVFSREKDHSRALEYYLSLLERDQDHPAALRGSALAYAAQRQYPQARDMLRKLLEGNDQDARSWLDLGDVLFRMGDHASALSHWEQAASLDTSAKEVIDRARRRLQLLGAPQSDAGEQDSGH